MKVCFSIADFFEIVFRSVSGPGRLAFPRLVFAAKMNSFCFSATIAVLHPTDVIEAHKDSARIEWDEAHQHHGSRVQKENVAAFIQILQ